MDKLIQILTPSIIFLRDNYKNFLVSLVALTIFYLIFKASLKTLKKLKIEVLPFYPFDQFLPQAGDWSIGYFLVILLTLGLLIFFLTKGSFYQAGPA